MDLLMPSTGLLFWMTIVFLVVLAVLWKWGFPAITKMVKERKDYIDDSLRKAKITELETAAKKKKESEKNKPRREFEIIGTVSPYRLGQKWGIRDSKGHIIFSLRMHTSS